MQPEKYTRQFYPVPPTSGSWSKKTYVDRTPLWCSVDLRDGNQALVIPMTLSEKLEYFAALVRTGFREIEIGFPASSGTEYAFCRTLIEQQLIPDDVTIQVLTQARPHIIEKTFEAIRGCKNAIVHLYHSISPVQREQVFHCTKAEIMQIATDSARLCREYRQQCGGDIRFEYSPENFTGTEPEFALQICNAVLDIWQPSETDPVIVNLPVTVELSMPHIYAAQVEYMHENLKYREHVVLSLHPHNDRGCAVADTEAGLLAGAQRVEGTLFGNGERTGNVDLVTLALNLLAQGVEPGLDLSDLPALSELYTRVTGMEINERQPYSGKLVFAAFSGSHQDAIAKGLKYREAHPDEHWTVPYLPIDPADIGRQYDAEVIRINSQSGKGGVGYILETKFGYDIPKRMREHLTAVVKQLSEHAHKELLPDEIFDVFKAQYVDLTEPLQMTDVHFTQKNGVEAQITVTYGGKTVTAAHAGNGSLDAVSNALQSCSGLQYGIHTYAQHALERGSTSEAVSYVEVVSGDGSFWGTGIDTDIVTSSVKAFVSAINNMLKAKQTG